MTQTLAVNDKNDIYIDGENNIAIAFDLEATLQACAQATKTLLNEMIYAQGQGVPYFETAYAGVSNLQQFEAATRNAILAVAGVVEIVSFILGQEGDTLSYSVVIKTVYGIGNIQNGG